MNYSENFFPQATSFSDNEPCQINVIFSLINVSPLRRGDWLGIMFCLLRSWFPNCSMQATLGALYSTGCGRCPGLPEPWVWEQVRDDTFQQVPRLWVQVRGTLMSPFWALPTLSRQDLLPVPSPALDRDACGAVSFVLMASTRAWLTGLKQHLWDDFIRHGKNLEAGFLVTVILGTSPH